MNTKEKSISEKINDLGVNTNLLYEIGGTLDNLKVLYDVVDENIEDLTNYASSNQNASIKYIEMKLNKIRQLGYIVENEHKCAEQNLNDFVNQVNN